MFKECRDQEYFILLAQKLNMEKQAPINSLVDQF